MSLDTSFWPTSEDTFWNKHKGAFFLEQIPGYLKTLVKLPIATRLNKLGHLVWTAGYLNNPT